MSDSQANNRRVSGRSEPALDRAIELVEFLRANCSWDAAQTHVSLRRYLLEEAHEVVDAIDDENDPDLRDELGDLLLNVAFQIVIAEERQVFDRQDVVDNLQQKMERRHPHLYGGEHLSWDRAKAREKAEDQDGDDGLLSDIVASSDGLADADKLQSAAAKVGFDWPDAEGPLAKIAEETEEILEVLRDGSGTERLEDEIGDLLFSVVNFARTVGIHSSTAMTRANQKFRRRFNRLELLARERGIDMNEADLDELDGLWKEIKRSGP